MNFNDDCWRIIKEFAGIYAIRNDWYKIIKIRNIDLFNFYRKFINKDVKDFRNNIHQKINMLTDIFSKPRTHYEMMSLHMLIDNIKVGDEVLWKNRYAGIISKINAKSICFRQYKINCKDVDTFYDESSDCLHVTYKWDKTQFEDPIYIVNYKTFGEANKKFKNNFVYYF